MLDESHLPEQSPGQELARAYARSGDGAAVTLGRAITTQFPPAQQRPRLTVRDLLGVARVCDERVMYAREEWAGEREPGAVAGAVDAPEARFSVTACEAGVGPIRASVEVPDAILADRAALAAYVDFRLIVRLCTAENDALLNGSAGLLGQEGLREQGAVGDMADTLLAAASTCEWFGGSADGIVMNPVDWWPLVKLPGLLAGLDAAGLRVNRTRMIAPGRALVGDFRAGATLLDAARSTIRLARDDAGATVLHGEVFEGLAVQLPGHFVVVALRPS